MNDVVEISDIGRRDINQDYKIADSENGIYILADGMGGNPHQAGEKISRFSSIYMHDELLNLRKSIDESSEEDRETIEELIGELIEGYMKEVNGVMSSASNSKGVKNWGTTLDACFIHKKKAYIGHSGDSSIYKINLIEESIELLTNPHNAKISNLYNLTDEEYQIIKNLGSISNYVGKGQDYFVETQNFPLEDYEILIMASDGLSKNLSSEEIKNCVLDYENQMPPKSFFQIYDNLDTEDLGSKLIKLAKNSVDMKNMYLELNKKGFDINIDSTTGDNITFIVIYGGGTYGKK